MATGERNSDRAARRIPRGRCSALRQAVAYGPRPAAWRARRGGDDRQAFTLMQRLALNMAEAGRIPDWLLRAGIRHLLRRRLEQSVPADVDAQAQATAQFIGAMDAGPVAIEPDLANAQHYEVPAAFFERVMGKHLKYSCCWFDTPADTLDAAEAAMLERTCERASIGDGMRILELGCGWGSLSLWMAQRYPSSRIVAVSNSPLQRAFIEARAAARGLGNLQVITADMNGFDAPHPVDRVVSVEMFEHMRNWRELFARVAGWLDDDGKFFCHVFCHRAVPYAFEDEGDDDWMSRHFFTGGMMPSADLALRFAESLQIEAVHHVSGLHYAATCRAWLENLDRHTAEVVEILAAGDNPSPPRVQFNRWRLFFMACEELFRFRRGNEWFVAHYRLRKR